MAEYIEREKLAEALKIWQNTLIEAYGEDDEYVRCLNSVLLGVDNAPAADVRENKRGKWEEVEVIYVDVDDEEHAFDAIASMRCNVCDRYHNEVYLYGNPTEMAHFCPNCGARMVNDNV